jgi:hypothetical protein
MLNRLPDQILEGCQVNIGEAFDVEAGFAQLMLTQALQ